MSPRSRALSVVAAAACVLPIAARASAQRDAAAVTATAPSASVSAVASSSASSSPSSSSSSGAPTETTPPSGRERPTRNPQKARRETVVDDDVVIENAEGTVDTDKQRVAVGIAFGPGVLATSGSGNPNPLVHLALVFDIGLGAGGARVPWTLEPWIGIGLPKEFVTGGFESHPDRLTEFGLRLRYTFPSGALAGRWISLGGALAETSWGDQTLSDVQWGGEVDVGVGFQEWVLRKWRFGFTVRAPIIIAAHPGGGAFLTFYGSVGLGGL